MPEFPMKLMWGRGPLHGVPVSKASSRLRVESFFKPLSTHVRTVLALDSSSARRCCASPRGLRLGHEKPGQRTVVTLRASGSAASGRTFPGVSFEYQPLNYVCPNLPKGLLTKHSEDPAVSELVGRLRADISRAEAPLRMKSSDFGWWSFPFVAFFLALRFGKKPAACRTMLTRLSACLSRIWRMWRLH